MLLNIWQFFVGKLYSLSLFRNFAGVSQHSLYIRTEQGRYCFVPLPTLARFEEDLPIQACAAV